MCSDIAYCLLMVILGHVCLTFSIFFLDAILIFEHHVHVPTEFHAYWGIVIIDVCVENSLNKPSSICLYVIRLALVIY